MWRLWLFVLLEKGGVVLADGQKILHWQQLMQSMTQGNLVPCCLNGVFAQSREALSQRACLSLY